jgi:hypothetical protein
MHNITQRSNHNSPFQPYSNITLEYESVWHSQSIYSQSIAKEDWRDSQLHSLDYCTIRLSSWKRSHVSSNVPATLVSNSQTIHSQSVAREDWRDLQLPSLNYCNIRLSSWKRSHDSSNVPATLVSNSQTIHSQSVARDDWLDLQWHSLDYCIICLSWWKRSHDSSNVPTTLVSNSQTIHSQTAHDSLTSLVISPSYCIAERYSYLILGSKHDYHSASTKLNVP